MTIQEIMNVKKGAFKSITFKSDNGILKRGKEEGLEKIQKMVVRFGIDYSNMKCNKVLVNGVLTSVASGSLPFGSWRISNYIITHKGVDYVRMYKSHYKVETTYLLNGEIVDKQWLIDNKYISSSTSHSDNKSGCMVVKLSNIICFN